MPRGAGGGGRDRRTTIADVARAAGVSEAAVSYALNNKQGVSEETRERILRVVESLQWTPSHAAQSLVRSRSDSVGLLLARSVDSVFHESLLFKFAYGLEEELRRQHRSLLLHFEDDPQTERRLYKQWADRGLVDAVVLLDLQVDDPRMDYIADLGFRVVLAGEPLAGMPDLPATFADDCGDMVRALEHLAAQGCRRIGRVSGPDSLGFVRLRSRGCDTFLRHRPDVAFGGREVAEWESEEGVVRAVTTLMSASPRPDALIFDSDVMAARGQRALLARGLRVPDDVAVMSFDDSLLCESTTPAMSALRRDPMELGRSAARLALGADGPDVRPLGPATVLSRASTARPPAPGAGPRSRTRGATA